MDSPVGRAHHHRGRVAGRPRPSRRRARKVASQWGRARESTHPDLSCLSFLTVSTMPPLRNLALGPVRQPQQRQAAHVRLHSVPQNWSVPERPPGGDGARGYRSVELHRGPGAVRARRRGDRRGCVARLTHAVVSSDVGELRTVLQSVEREIRALTRAIATGELESLLDELRACEKRRGDLSSALTSGSASRGQRIKRIAVEAACAAAWTSGRRYSPDAPRTVDNSCGRCSSRNPVHTDRRPTRLSLRRGSLVWAGCSPARRVFQLMWYRYGYSISVPWLRTTCPDPDDTGVRGE